MTDAIIILIVLAILVFALGGAKKRLKGGCCGGDGEIRLKPTATKGAPDTHHIAVQIEGMTCNHCKLRVENAFHALPDCYAEVHLKKHCADVWSKKEFSDEELAELVQKIGYTFKGCSRF